MPMIVPRRHGQKQKKERNIFMTTQSVSLETTIRVLKETIAWFKKRIEPHDCGWMHTTIHGLKHRVKELRKDFHGTKGR